MNSEKCIVIGWDAPIVERIQKYLDEGNMPNTKRLIEKGVWAENCLVPHPTITPPNWTTIATGAWPGTHQIICFNMLEQGRLDRWYQAFFHEDCKAEYIWNAAARIGKKSIVINYPSTWPQAVKNGIQLGGAGLAINDYRTFKGKKWSYRCDAGADFCYTTEDLPGVFPLEFESPSGWENLPECKSIKQAKIKMILRYAIGEDFDIVELDEPSLYMLVFGDENEFNTAGIYLSRNANEPLCILKENQWSEKIYMKIKTKQGEKRVVFKIKLLRLSPDGKDVKIYFTPLCSLSGWGFPSGIEKELENLEGLPVPNSFYYASLAGWIDMETLSEMIDMQNTWLGEAAAYLVKNKEWSIFYMHAHCPDHFYHGYINRVESDVSVENAERRFYNSLDNMLGKILSSVDENKTLVIITSDHGATPTENIHHPDYKVFDVNEILAKKGLCTITQDPVTGVKDIDWTKTKAVSLLSCYIFINLKSRYPHGIVEDNEYEDLRNEIIKALYDYTDPLTGKKPVAFAFKKEDARIIGLYGEKIGDIVYGLYPETSGEHGRQITTGRYGIGSLKGLFIAKGSGIKKGLKLERTVWLTDIVPTICYALNLPVPAQCEGGILYQIFEDPDFRLKEFLKTKENYERLKKVFDSERHLTHNY